MSEDQPVDISSGAHHLEHARVHRVLGDPELPTIRVELEAAQLLGQPEPPKFRTGCQAEDALQHLDQLSAHQPWDSPLGLFDVESSGSRGAVEESSTYVPNAGFPFTRKPKLAG